MSKKTKVFDADAARRDAAAALRAAQTIPDVLAAIATGQYARDYGAECPPDRIPTPEALCETDFLRSISPGTWTAYGDALAKIAGRWPDPLPPGQRRAAFIQFIPTGEIDSFEFSTDRKNWESLDLAPDTFLKQRARIQCAAADFPGYCAQHATAGFMPDIEADAAATAKQDRFGMHPCAPLVRAWMEWKAVPVNASDRKDPIAPAPLFMFPDRENKGYLPALSMQQRGGETLYLPGLGPGPDGGELDGPALPLQLYDLGNGIEGRAKGSFLALKMWMEAVLAVPQKERGRGIVELPPERWGDFLQRMYPGTAGSWRRTGSGGWDSMHEAFRLLDSQEALMPVQNPDGGWQARRIVFVADRPASGYRSEYVRFAVNLRPGTENGFLLDIYALRVAGVISEAAYRLFISLSAMWHKPGKTRFQVKRGVWLQTRQIEHYARLSQAQLTRYAFPVAGAQSTGRIRDHKARKALLELCGRGFCATDCAADALRFPVCVMPGPKWTGWGE